jgi:hypothetical protein
MGQFFVDHWLGMLVSVIAAMVVGAIWYAPPVFGNTWQKLVGLKEKDMKTGVAKAYIIMVIVAIVTAFVLQRFLIITNPDSLYQAVKVGLWLWLGFVATYAIGGGVFEHRPGKLIAINLGNNLVTLLVMSAILYLL